MEDEDESSKGDDAELEIPKDISSLPESQRPFYQIYDKVQKGSARLKATLGDARPLPSPKKKETKAKAKEDPVVAKARKERMEEVEELLTTDRSLCMVGLSKSSKFWTRRGQNGNGQAQDRYTAQTYKAIKERKEGCFL